MIEHLKAFLRFLALNRNVSPHTVRATGSRPISTLDATTYQLRFG